MPLAKIASMDLRAGLANRADCNLALRWPFRLGDSMVESSQRADWPFIREGAITLFYRTDLFGRAKALLAGLDYALVEVSCRSTEQVIEQISEGLKWVDQFGYGPWTGNLNAFDEGFAGLQFPASGCFALCLESFHRLNEESPDFALGLLDVVETQSRNHLVDGLRSIALIQTDDPAFQTPKLGGCAARWNWDEWLTTSRSPSL